MACTLQVVLAISIAGTASTELWQGGAERRPATGGPLLQCSGDETLETPWEVEAMGEASLLQTGLLALDPQQAGSGGAMSSFGNACIWITVALFIVALCCIGCLCMESGGGAEQLLSSRKSEKKEVFVEKAESAQRSGSVQDNDAFLLGKDGPSRRQPTTREAARTLPSNDPYRQSQEARTLPSNDPYRQPLDSLEERETLRGYVGLAPTTVDESRSFVTPAREPFKDYASPASTTVEESRNFVVLAPPVDYSAAGQEPAPLSRAEEPKSFVASALPVKDYDTSARDLPSSFEENKSFGAPAPLVTWDTAAVQELPPPPICPMLVLPRIESSFLISMDSAQDAFHAYLSGFDILGPSFKKLFHCYLSVDGDGRRSLAISPPDVKDVLCSITSTSKTSSQMELFGEGGKPYGVLEELPRQLHVFLLSVGGRPHARIQVQDAASCTLACSAFSSERGLASAAPYVAAVPGSGSEEPSSRISNLWRVLARPQSDALLMVLSLLGLSLFKLS